MVRPSAQSRELIRLTPVHFSISVGIVVILLAAASLVGYHIGRTEAERASMEASHEKPDFTANSDLTSSRADTPAQVTFYSVLTESRDEVSGPKRPEIAPLDRTGTQKSAEAVEDNLSLIVQIASYKRREAAGGLLEKLSAEGYSGSVHVADLGERGIWYRVRLGPFESEEKAREVLSRMREERNLKGYIVR